ncbi:extracellular solute-binding protein [Cohnella endophytica]|uniref:Extracellular solute-binding protein n=1 Tax=Cohnella endophytica TaxID=2419778 RepID=A0A494XLS9_9BACL|nr:extracellular solute-binding protein [Cohnella endophytica]RKP51568.1 extracellular solute-binding protein [Cohnella endophytica]
MNRTVKWGFTTLAALVFLTGCNAGSSNKQGNGGEKAAAKQVNLTFYLNNQGGQEYLNTMQTEVIDTFEAKYPNVHIKLTKNADPEGLAKQQLAAGGGPDIVAMNGPSSLQDFVSAKYLLPLDKYGEEYKWKERYYPWALSSMTSGGKPYGVPGPYETLVVYYNKQMFSDNGWQIPNTYDELINLCKQMQAKDIIPFSFGSSDYKAANEWWLSVAFNQTLGADKFKEVLKGNVPWNSPEVTEAIQKMDDLWKAGYINAKQSQAITLDDSMTLFNSGKTAMKMEGTWLLGTLEETPPTFEWDVFTMPAWKDGVEANLPLALGGAYGVNKNTKNPDEAAAFIDWINRSEQASKFLKLGNFTPINDMKVDNLEPHVEKAFKLLNEAMGKKQTGYAAWMYWPPSMETYAYSNIETVWLGQTDLQTFMNKLQEAFEQDKQKDRLFKFED